MERFYSEASAGPALGAAGDAGPARLAGSGGVRALPVPPKARARE